MAMKTFEYLEYLGAIRQNRSIFNITLGYDESGAGWSFRMKKKSKLENQSPSKATNDLNCDWLKYWTFRLRI
jgi:hypothetical protein